jgi:hypothetical protein
MTHIEKRQSIRIDYKLRAELTFKDKTFKGFIENFSREGIFKIIIPERQLAEFIPGIIVKVNFQDPSGKTFELQGEVKWLRIKSEPPIGVKYNMGIEIINPPQKYKEFVEDLFEKSSS